VEDSLKLLTGVVVTSVSLALVGGVLAFSCSTLVKAATEAIARPSPWRTRAATVRRRGTRA
jgi:hypothetical protein